MILDYDFLTESMCSLLRKRVLSCTVYDTLLSLITSEEEEEGERGKDWSLSTAEEYAKKLIISNNDNVSHMANM